MSYFPSGHTRRRLTAADAEIVGTSPANTYVIRRDQCTDYRGEPKKDHPLFIEHIDRSSFSTLSGTYNEPSGGGYRSYEQFFPEGLTGTVHLATGKPSDSVLATSLRARTNPSREEVSIPNFLYELKDLPGMYKDIMMFKTRLRNLGKGSPAASGRTIANYHLSLQMGWKPLISDLSKLLKFQASVDRRIAELNRLYSNRGLKRRCELFSFAGSMEEEILLSTALGLSVKARSTRLTKQTVWGTIRWIPTAVPKDLRRPDLARKARKLVLGLDHRGIDATQAWNALPWSWLIDWFTNTGEFLHAYRNDVPAQPTGPCNIMTRTYTRQELVRTDSLKFWVGGEGVRHLTSLERAQSVGSLSVTLPFINQRQWSILGALALQRLRL